MKIEKLSQNKIKITINDDDAKRLNIGYDNLMQGTGSDGELFWEIMDVAQRETGVVFENCKLTVEVIQSKDSFVMIITKGDIATQTQRRPRTSRKVRQQRQSAMYQFETFDNLCSFASMHSLYGDILNGVNNLYKYEGKYYLTVDFGDRFEAIKEEFELNIIEFGTKMRSSILEGAVKERGALLIKKQALINLSKI